MPSPSPPTKLELGLIVVTVLSIALLLSSMRHDLEGIRAQQTLPPAVAPVIALEPYGVSIVDYDAANKMLTIRPRNMPQDALICVDDGVRAWCGIPAQPPKDWAPR